MLVALNFTSEPATVDLGERAVSVVLSTDPGRPRDPGDPGDPGDPAIPATPGDPGDQPLGAARLALGPDEGVIVRY